jgi:hypothetical protein
MEFTVKVAINAPSRDEAIDEVNDLLIIRNALKNRNDLKTLAKLLKENPSLVQVAKKHLGK